MNSETHTNVVIACSDCCLPTVTRLVKAHAAHLLVSVEVGEHIINSVSVPNEQFQPLVAALIECDHNVIVGVQSSILELTPGLMN